MLNIFNRHVFSIAFTAQLLIAGSFYSNSAMAAARCSVRNLVESSSRAEASSFKINKINGVEKIKLKPNSLKKIKSIFEDNNWELRSTKIREIIEIVASKVKGRSNKPSIEKSNKMAEVGREILEAVQMDLTEAQFKMATYMIAESVLRLESIPLSEYKRSVGSNVFEQNTTVQINKFHKLVESYIDNSTTYRNLSNDGNIIDWPEIRRLYTNNSWTVGLRPHDMYHLHYSYGHPYYLAVNLHTSRSINDRRYIMTSTLWESVDTFRTSYESSIANYFKSKNMSPQEAMLFIGRATEKELDTIEQTIGSHTTAPNYNDLAYTSGWRPIKTSFGRGRSPTENVLLKEVADFINTSLDKMKDPENKKYINYHRQGPGMTSPRDADEVAGF
ncbi:MAG: hypothetical protein AABY53_01195 [Bdellovibrionota bacterium]